MVPSGSGDQNAVDGLGDEDAEVTGWSEEGYSWTPDYSWLLATVSTVVPNDSGDQYAVDLVDEDAEVTGWSEEGYSWTPDYSWLLATVSTVVPNVSGGQYAVDLIDEDAEVTV